MVAELSDYMMPVTRLPREVTKQKVKPAQENVPH